jgi:hypothetical protein
VCLHLATRAIRFPSAKIKARQPVQDPITPPPQTT